MRQKALLRFRDGRVEPSWFVGTLPLEPQAGSITYESEDGSTMTADLAELKAIFLLRPWDSEVSLLAPDATRVTVEFFDGEQVRGSASGWGPGRTNFILVPEDQSRVEAIVVVSASLVSVEVENA